MNNIKYGILMLAMALFLTACSKNEPEPTATVPTGDEAQPMEQTADEMPAEGLSDDLRSKLADPSRPAADRARDEARKPADVVELLGIEPGMKVLDIIAAGGYYTEVLSLAVGPEGEVVAQNTEGALEYSDGANEKAISARLADDRLPNVSRLNKNFDEITDADGEFDAAITAMNFHDIYNGSGPEAAAQFLETIYGMLKPGGVLGITDHVGVAGADNAALHRIEKSKVIEAAKAAGFVLEDDSDLLSNDADDHSEAVFSEGIRGHTDRFLLKLRKPEA